MFPVAISGSHLSRVQANRLFCSCNAYSPGTQCGALFPEKVQKVRLEDGTKNKVHFVTQFPGTNPRLARNWRRRWDTTGIANVIGKEYFVRQAAILFGLAKATTDPKISAALLDKAADLKLQVDERGVPSDVTPIAPDIEPPAR